MTKPTLAFRWRRMSYVDREDEKYAVKALDYDTSDKYMVLEQAWIDEFGVVSWEKVPLREDRKHHE